MSLQEMLPVLRALNHQERVEPNGPRLKKLRRRQRAIVMEYTKEWPHYLEHLRLAHGLSRPELGAAVFGPTRSMDIPLFDPSVEKPIAVMNRGPWQNIRRLERREEFHLMSTAKLLRMLETYMELERRIGVTPLTSGT